MRYSGCFYTWSNKQQPQTRVYSKLDRTLVNMQWISLWPQAETVFLNEGISDHSPIVIDWKEHQAPCPALFKFFNMLAKDESFIDIVKETWDVDIQGYAMYRVMRKQKLLQNPLRDLNITKYADIDKKEIACRQTLERTQNALADDPSNVHLQKLERDASREYMKIADAANCFLKQKAKENWLRDADQNTKYFHEAIKLRHYRNRVLSIKDENDVLVSSQHEVCKVFDDYFTKLFQRSRTNWNISEAEINQGRILSPDQQITLIKPVSDDEIRDAFMSMGSNKSPGPDGYGAEFYKSAWDVIGPEICEAIRDFFRTGQLLKEVNNTSLVLIPKVDCPNYASDFRPIACCNSIYKCIAKILSNRMQNVLPGLVQDNQTAFVSGRNIIQNILITQDLLRLYGRSHVSPRCLMKIDLRKAYDILDWSFVKNMLMALKFPMKFIDWIMACISTVSFNLVLNGRSFGCIKSHRGLRQGDPMSPLLFVLSMEMLTRKLQAATNSRGFRFHPLCRNLRLVNLAFADDIMLFCHGSETSVRIVMNAFHDFSASSGLVANNAKSHIYMAGISETIQDNLQHITGFSKGSFPFRYLGLPISTRKWSSHTCQLLVDKVTKRINSWKSRHLSYQGKTLLINSVLLSLHVYWASVFIIPKSVVHKIEQKCRIFLWGTNQSGRSRSIVAWDLCCRPKKAGGLGFKNTIIWNQAALGKQVWQIALKKNILWVKWISSVYLNDIDFWDYQAGSQDSWHWKQILKVRDKFRQSYANGDWTDTEFTIKKGYQCLIGNQDTVIWSKTVWNAASIPKHCFIFWLATINKLRTKANLAAFDDSDPTCVLCNDNYEDRDHLFFDCTWSRDLMELVCNWIGLEGWCTNFQSWLHWLTFGFKHKKRSQFITAIMAATLYHVWMERNRRIFVDKARTPSQVFNLVKRDLVIRLNMVFPCLNSCCNNVIATRILAEL